MKVLIVTGIFPPDHGGPASYVPLVARGLQQLGHEIVAVITLSDRLDHDDSHHGFPVVRIPRGRARPIRWLQTISVIARLAPQADVIYLNGLVLEGIVAGKLLARRPTVVKVVGDLIWEKARNSGATDLELDEFQNACLPLRWRLLRRLQSWYTALADAVITPSRYLACIVARWGVDPTKIHIIYNSVTLPPPSQTSSSEYDLVTVARLVPWKGLADLIEASGKLGLRLRIVGDGPLRTELEALAQRCNAQVSFAGYVAKERIPDEIRRARLFVLNSSYEGLPHVVLEAKAAGVAVLATTAGGTPEIVHHGVDGWLIPPNDKPALVEAVCQLLGDAQIRANLIRAGLRQIAEQFNPITQNALTASVLAKVCR
jgi:glycosyltransferase involved in cell wall biosynthesis